MFFSFSIILLKWCGLGSSGSRPEGTWHMVWDEHYLKNVRFLALTVLELSCFEDLEENDCLINESIVDKGVCRTALATPGLLKTQVFKFLTYYIDPFLHIHEVTQVTKYNKKLPKKQEKK